MIDFGNYYHFAPEQVECLEVENAGQGPNKYALWVHLKSGKKFGISYATQKARDEAHRSLAHRINAALRQDADRFHTRLYLVEDAVKRIDKRQLKIWRQLKALLQLTANEDEEE